MSTKHGDKVASTQVPAGTILGGRYEVESTIGAGGMGVVVAAKHLELGHTVAIKIMHSTFRQDPLIEERFLREARSVAALRSPHTVRVVDAGRSDTGEPFLVMELLEGESLSQIIKRNGPLPIRVATAIIAEACRALEEAHDRGLVHRDVKPGNIFLARCPDGSRTVKVLDFGIAKQLPNGGAGEEVLTATGEMMGSPNYVAPEQLRSPRDVDRRADIWALGTVLYELIAGQRAFRGDYVGTVLLAITTEDPPSIVELRPETPVELARVIARALQKDPSARYADAAELRADLMEFAATVPVLHISAQAFGGTERVASTPRAGSTTGRTHAGVVAASPVAAPPRSVGTFIGLAAAGIALVFLGFVLSKQINSGSSTQKATAVERSESTAVVAPSTTTEAPRVEVASDDPQRLVAPASAAPIDTAVASARSSAAGIPIRPGPTGKPTSTTADPTKTSTPTAAPTGSTPSIYTF